VWEQEVRSRSVTLRDYDFEVPPASGLEVGKNADKGREEHELYDYPGRYVQRERGSSLADLRLQSEVADEILFRGQGDCRAFVPGFHFELTDHPRRVVNRDLLLVSVHHRVSEPVDTGESGAVAAAYQNNFTAVRYETPYRPPRMTRKPVVEGLQSAVVTGPEGEYVHTDKYGRVKVKFHWDRSEASDDTSSCWLRVSMGRAGKGWGDVSLPHVGQEVLVDFLEGDPDRPIVTGRVYNADNAPFYGLPDAKFKTSIRDDFGNQLVFDSSPGSEHISLTSPHHTSELYLGKSIKYMTESDFNQWVLGDWTKATLGSSGTLQVGATGSAVVGAAGSLFIGGRASMFLGFDASLSCAGKIESNRSWRTTYTRGKNYSSNTEKTFKHGDSSFTKHQKGRIKLDTEDEAWIVGGEPDKAFARFAENELLLSFGRGKDYAIDPGDILKKQAIARVAMAATLGITAATMAVTAGLTMRSAVAGDRGAAGDDDLTSETAASGSSQAEQDRVSDHNKEEGSQEDMKGEYWPSIIALGAQGGAALLVMIGLGIWMYRLSKKKAKDKTDPIHDDPFAYIRMNETGLFLKGGFGSPAIMLKHDPQDVTIHAGSGKKGSGKITLQGLGAVSLTGGSVSLTAADGNIEMAGTEVLINKSLKVLPPAPPAAPAVVEPAAGEPSGGPGG
jgi:hypothetical protein